MSPEQVEELREYWGVGVPMTKRFASWFSGLLKGDMGISLLYRRPVIEIVGERFLSSLWLMASAWVFAGVLGLLLGILAGTFRGRWPDRLITGYCMLTASTPAFWIGLLLLLVFAVQLRIFPIGLGVPIGMESAQVTFADRLSHAFLPAPDSGAYGNFIHRSSHEGEDGGGYGQSVCALCQGQGREPVSYRKVPWASQYPSACCHPSVRINQ